MDGRAQSSHLRPINSCEAHADEHRPDKSEVAGVNPAAATNHTKVSSLSHDRLIVVTDEHSADRVPEPKGLGYMINVASNRNGVGYGKWLHVDGWSDAVVRFITEHECADGASE
jgi:hypothetical protein